MGRALLATGLVAIGLACGSAGGAAASASAEAAVWHHYNFYGSLDECTRAGKYLVATGAYRAWACVDSGQQITPWDLRVLD
ncbi:hypothetical protein [Nonomuraea sp. NPDC050783]|uniref:hypothetical protein n=1 Tax=Nonomuraea sp. NPDC050783 TaxID=3154634 RepID=UPI003466EE75